MKLVSCICPSKRGLADLQRTIDDFLAQTYPCKELIVLRTDLLSAKTIVQSYPEQILCSVVPIGLSIGELRNIACRLSRGSVIAHWDDDDLSHPERLARSMAAIDAGASLVGSSRVIYERVALIERSAREPYGVYEEERFLFDGSALTPTYLVGGTLVYRRELWEKYPFHDVEMGEDSRFQWATMRDFYELLTRDKEQGDFAVDLKDEALYTARMDSTNTSPKDTGSPGWSRL